MRNVNPDAKPRTTGPARNFYGGHLSRSSVAIKRTRSGLSKEREAHIEAAIAQKGGEKTGANLGAS
jgi:hypothetical protein